MTQFFSKSALILIALTYFSVYPSLQVNVSPKVDFVEDNKGEAIPPKIQGVRVIVDAMKGGKMDDKTETIRIHTDGAQQTVGIHTDITFEIDKKNDTKPTDGRNAESSENDDTEVPIYRGTHTEEERRSYDYDRRRDPNEYYRNQANFHGVNDEDSVRYGDAGTWVRFLPMANGAWTTERYSESFTPQTRRFPPNGFVRYGIGQKSFRPCICDDRSMWRDANRRSFVSSTLRPQGTDDKLEYPFSETD